jgi:hypothetical protein
MLGTSSFTRPLVWRDRRLSLLWAVAGSAGLVVVSIELGRFTAANSVRMISLVLVAVAAPLLAQLSPTRLVTLTIALSPLPLYMQGVRASLTLGLIIGVWLAWLIQRSDARLVGLSRGFGAPVTAVAITTLVALARGQSARTSQDLIAAGKLFVGLAIFAACLLTLRSTADVRRGFVAIGAAGAIVFAVSLFQLTFASVHVPGLVTGVGSVQAGDPGVATNLRVGGPIGDYELLGEFFGLVGTVAIFLGMSGNGPSRLRWFLLLPMSVIGIAMTSTRSGLVILVLGAAACLVTRPNATRRVRRAALLLAGLVFIALPAIGELQARFGTGYLFERVAALPHRGGLLYALDRAAVWHFFWNQLPPRGDLLFGSGPAFDYARFGTYPHSLPLTLVFTVGVLGAAAFCSLLLLIEVRCLRAWRSHRSSFALLGAVLIGLFALNEIKVEYVRVFNYQWFVWALLGVAAASSRTMELREPTGERLQ